MKNLRMPVASMVDISMGGLDGAFVFDNIPTCTRHSGKRNNAPGCGLTISRNQETPCNKHATLSICSGYATIVLQSSESLAGPRLHAHAFRAAALQCFQNQESMHTVFLWVCGDQCHHSEHVLASNKPPLPIWAKTDGHAVGIEAQGTPIGIDADADSFEEALELLRGLPQPVIGLVDGVIDSCGTSALSVCNRVIATRATEFHPMRNTASQGGKTSERLSRLLQNLTISATKAYDIGFVTALVDSTDGLLQERNSLKFNLQKQACEYQDSFYSSPWPLTMPTIPQREEAPLVHAVPTPQWSDTGYGALGAAAWQDEGTVPCRTGIQDRGGFGTGTCAKVEQGELPFPQKALAHVMGENAVCTSAPEKNMVVGSQGKKDFSTQYFSHEGPITSLMIRNLPCCITQCQLVEVIDTLGFKGTYDFLHLPTGGRSAAMRANNLGYGFINFIEHADAERFCNTFSGYHFEGSYSEKACAVRPAHIQGLNSNLRNLPHKRRARGRGTVFAVKSTTDQQHMSDSKGS